MKDVLYFASGSNIPQDVRGMSEVGQPIGLAVHEMQEDTELELARLVGTGLPVFLDSGAFSEVVFREDGPEVVSPITDEEWDRRLTAYERLAALLGSQLYVVAPDKIGFQEDTLERLARWAHRVRRVRDMGANVLVPIQCGTMSRAAFGQEVAAILDGIDWIPAFPCKKGGTSIEEIAGYVGTHHPSAIHLLGLGIKQRSFIEVLQGKIGKTRISCDSMMLRPYVGKGRPLTEAKRRIGEDLMAEIGCWGTPHGAVMQREAKPLLDYTDHIASPSLWATRGDLSWFADAIGLDGDERRSWMRDPDAWLQEDDRWDDPVVDYALDGMWRRYHLGNRAALARERHRRAIHEVFGPRIDPPVPDGEVIARRWRFLRSVMRSIRGRAGSGGPVGMLREEYRRTRRLSNAVSERYHSVVPA